MGKGDKKSKRGKIFRGSFGKRRPKRKHHAATAGDATVAAGAPAASLKEPKVVKRQTKEE
jgi:30S ribosomal protein S31